MLTQEQIKEILNPTMDNLGRWDSNPVVNWVIGQGLNADWDLNGSDFHQELRQLVDHYKLDNHNDPRSIRLRAIKQGGHYHTVVYTANSPNQTYAKCGEVVFDEKDMQSLLNNNYVLEIEVHDNRH